MIGRAVGAVAATVALACACRAKTAEPLEPLPGAAPTIESAPLPPATTRAMKSKSIGRDPWAFGGGTSPPSPSAEPAPAELGAGFSPPAPMHPDGGFWAPTTPLTGVPNPSPPGP